MQARTATVVLDAPKEQVFDFLAEPMNAQQWATEFVKTMERVDGEVVATTARGRFLYRVAAEPHTGVVDISVGPDADRLALFPARVVGIDPKRSLFSFTMLQPAEASDAEFDSDYASLLRELQVLRTRFEAA